MVLHPQSFRVKPEPPAGTEAEGKAAAWRGSRAVCRNGLSSLVESKVKVAQSCPTLGDPMNYTVHGILQARILEWVTYPFSKGSFQPRDRTQVSRNAGRFFTS